MKVSLAIEGGVAHFPGLARPRTVDLDALPTDERAELARLVAAADPDAAWEDAPPTAARGGDRRVYVISVEDDFGAVTQRRVPEPVQDPALRELIDYLRSHRA
jgi:hypothetical protein